MEKSKDKNTIEYQIFIGCTDSQLKREIITIEELIKKVANYFTRKKIDFSILRANGGYLDKNNWFTTENSLYINIIGPSNLDIIKLTKSLSMFMNQEYSLIIKNNLKIEFK